jgi:hypothetical protein
MKSLLTFAFAILGTALLAGDTFGGEENTQAEKDNIAVSDLDANCNSGASKRVIPSRL